MKFVNYLEKIGGVSIYPMVSLLLFTVIFILVVIFAMRTSDETVKEMENLPLDDN
ncbi:MAG: CcoQ/FixQ family Cbb3-type cytochrome c oxidase assembly chaperone [Niabella sp.]